MAFSKSEMQAELASFSDHEIGLMVVALDREIEKRDLFQSDLFLSDRHLMDLKHEFDESNEHQDLLDALTGGRSRMVGEER